MSSTYQIYHLFPKRSSTYQLNHLFSKKIFNI
jgi:hypothetical protein